MTASTIPFSKATVVPHQEDYVRESMASGLLSGDGPFTARASALLADLHDGADVLLTTSCTSALDMAALLLDIEPGDEVIIPSFTFVSTASAFALRGATVVFADIDPITWGLDGAAVAALCSERTRAIVPVHYGGVAVDMAALQAAADDCGAHIVEDNAHGLFGFDESGQRLGTFGSMSTLSFHATKNISCGEGGALVMNDPQFVDRAEILREKGTNRRQFMEGRVDKYRWVDVGSSFLPSDLLAAVLTAQLEAAESVQGRRQEIWSRYAEALRPWTVEQGARIFADDPDGDPTARQHPAHLFALELPTTEARGGVLATCKARGVQATFHYVPLHSSPAGLRVGNSPHGCPVTDAVSERLVRLPLHTEMTDADVDRVIEAVRACG